MSEAPGQGEDMVVYRVSRPWKIVLIVISLASLGLSGMFLFFTISGKGEGLAGRLLLSAGGAAFLAIPLYFFFYLRRFAIRVDSGAIRVRYAWREKTMSLADIGGYRLVTSGYVPVITFLSKTPKKKKLSVELAIERRGPFLEWAAALFPDVDEKANVEDLVAVLADDTMGISGGDRLSFFTRMKTTTRGINIVAVSLGLLGLFWPQPYALVIVCLAAFPFIALASIRLSRGLIRFDVRQKDIHPSILTAVLVPAGVLMLRALFDFNILEWRAFWAPFALFTAALFGVYLVVHKGIKVGTGSMICSILFFAVYGYGAAVTLNGLKDTSSPDVYHAEVTGKHVSSGKSTSYYIELSPWGPKTKGCNVDVGSRRYARYGVGDGIDIWVHEGLLGIRWFDVN